MCYNDIVEECAGAYQRTLAKAGVLGSTTKILVLAIAAAYAAIPQNGEAASHLAHNQKTVCANHASAANQTTGSSPGK